MARESEIDFSHYGAVKELIYIRRILAPQCHMYHVINTKYLDKHFLYIFLNYLLTTSFGIKIIFSSPLEKKNLYFLLLKKTEFGKLHLTLTSGKRYICSIWTYSTNPKAHDNNT